ncbi:hypothetical protein ACLBOM_25225 [Escherichia coli]
MKCLPASPDVADMTEDDVDADDSIRRDRQEDAGMAGSRRRCWSLI